MCYVYELRELVRQWYGNLPIYILVRNKDLQKTIIEFESYCERRLRNLPKSKQVVTQDSET